VQLLKHHDISLEADVQWVTCYKNLGAKGLTSNFFPCIQTMVDEIRALCLAAPEIMCLEITQQYQGMYARVM
jgi:hypothetical protein